MATVIAFRTGKPVAPPAPEVLPVASPAVAAPPVVAPPVVAKRRRGDVTAEMRKALLAKVHVAKAQLAKQQGMTDEDYRAMLGTLFGVSSAAELEAKALHRLLAEMVRLGFTPGKGSARRGADRKKVIPAALQPEATDPLGRQPYMEKIEALLAEKGRVEGTAVPWGYAVAILKRQTGGVIRCLDHADVGQLRAVIAALVRDARRKGRRTNG